MDSEEVRESSGEWEKVFSYAVCFGWLSEEVFSSLEKMMLTEEAGNASSWLLFFEIEKKEASSWLLMPVKQRWMS